MNTSTVPTAGPRGRQTRIVLTALFLIAVVTGGPGGKTAAQSTWWGYMPLAGCDGTSTGATPLTDLTETYKGSAGGLYPGGWNTPPAAHVAAGVALANAIGPLDRNGQPNANGRYVFMSIGMSNTEQEFASFEPLANQDAARTPRLTIVNAALGSMTADQWASPACPCWQHANQLLSAAGVTRRQVVSVWVKLAEPNPSLPYPDHAEILRDDLVATLHNLKAYFPNLKLAYLSSRIYGGYATNFLNPEPYAYESAFAVRSVIANQLNGDPALNFDPARGSVRAPWLAWGPYLWADGLRPRSDGLRWSCNDMSPMDGTHPSTKGALKVANLLLLFVKSDPTARIWFRGW